MSMINSCSVTANSRNTGSECNDNLKASAMIIMVPKAAKWQLSDMTGVGAMTAFLDTKIHAAPGSRFWPIFGTSAPIRAINEAKENDVIETLDDGSMQFIRYGMFNRTFVTTEGGLCLAQHLMSFTGSNYAFIEVDIMGNVAMMLNADGSYSGFPVNLAYAPTPELANLKTAYKNQFMLSFSPNVYIKRGEMFASDTSEDVLSLRGLFDTQVVKAANSTTIAGSGTATGGLTVVIGATGDTIHINVPGLAIYPGSGMDISGSVIQTSSETTATLLAAKIVTAINAKTSTNGGFSATNSAGAITLSVSGTVLGETINGVIPTAIITGTITTTTPVAFAGGVGKTTLNVGVNTICGDTDLVGLYTTVMAQPTNFTVGNFLNIESATLVNGYIALVVPPCATGTITVSLNIPSVLKANGIEGYEGVQSATIATP